MGEYRGHLRGLDGLSRLAFAEAKRLGSMAVGPEELLLAILHPDAPESIAARALRDAGIDRDALAELVRAKGSRNEIEGGPQLNPAGYQLMSLAEGMAAGMGAPVVAPEHVLLGFLWEPGWAARLEHLGCSREDLAARLAQLGVRLPQAELPPRDSRRWGASTDVPIEDLPILLRHLPYVMPRDAQLSFNHDWRKAWIGATEGVDLAVHLPRARARHRRPDLPAQADEPS